MSAVDFFRPIARKKSPAAVWLVLAQLGERRRSLLSWGLPIGLWSAFVVAIYPSVEDALAKAIASYPEALKQAFGIGELTSVEQYLNAEMLGLIVPLAVAYLAVRAVASGLSGAAESGRLDVLLSAPVSRRRLVAASFLAAAGSVFRYYGKAVEDGIDPLAFAAVTAVAVAVAALGALLFERRDISA